MTPSDTRPGLTILFEFNCYHWRPKATIWLYPGLVGQVLESDDGPGLPGRRKLVGPLPQAQALAACEALRETLRAAGVPFDDTSSADD